MKTIKLKKFGVGEYLDNTPLVIDGDISVMIENTPYTGGEYKALCKIGNNDSVIPVVDGVFTIPKPKTGGLMEVCLHYYIHGEKVAEWAIEPIVIKEMEEGTFAFPVIEGLKTEIEQLRKAFSEYKNATETVLDNIQKTQAEFFRKNCEAWGVQRKAVVALMSYSYRHYCNDNLDNGKNLTAEEFFKSFGFDIALFKGESDDILSDINNHIEVEL